MKSFKTNLIAALIIGSLGIAGDASACNGGGRNGSGRNGGQGNPNSNCNNQACNANGGYNSNVNGSTFGQAYEPFHSTYSVQPGDTFYEVSLKEYGTSAATAYISRFNRLAPNTALVPGQRLSLPSISANGQLTPSRAPASESLNALRTSVTASTATYSKPSITVVKEPTTTIEPARPSVPTGSVIKLDGQSLGAEKGVVRLRISNVAMPIEVVEWSAESTKVRMPKLDVNGGTKAELEVVRADGTVAATNAIELTSAVSTLASAK
jgi:hypothetical protein